jgi:hypothetical protein
MTSMMRQRFNLLVALFPAHALAGCNAGTVNPCARKFPDVVSARAQARSPDTFDFDVTVSFPYDTPQRYADAFHVTGKDGMVFGERTLFHDHATEQPFTRDLYGVRIPSHVSVIVIHARDRKYGYGGKTVEVAIPGR